MSIHVKIKEKFAFEVGEGRMKMNNELITSELLFLLIIYIGVTLYLIFGKNIPLQGKWLFSKDRKKTFIAADLTLIFTYIIMFYLQFYFFKEPSSANLSLIIFSFRGLSSLLNAMEDWLTNKETKAHYHGWTGFGFSVIVIIILLLAM